MKAKGFFQFLVIMILIVMTMSPGNVSALSQVLYVAPGGLTSGSCDDWVNACDFQYALTSAVSGQEIWVMAGVYKPTTGTDRTATFQLKNGVAVYGGFAGTETDRNQRDPAANVTILSGDLNGDDNSNVNIVEPTRLDNSYHVVTGATDTALDGFTISAGNAYVTSGGGLYNESGNPTLINIIFSRNSAHTGGGMYNISSDSPILTNVTFSDNSAYYGGGMYNAGSSPTLTHITFIDNIAFDRGGGMYNSGNPTLTDVAFIGNSAVEAGGMHNYPGSSPTLTNVTFSGNSAVQGGGMENMLSSPTLIDVTFSGNTATQIGGGMLNQVNAPVLTRVTFMGNSAYYGGGMGNNQEVDSILTNVTFSGNSATYGGGMINIQGDKPTLTNVTFSNNSANYGGGMYNWMGSNPQINDTIFWGNTASNSGAQIYDNTAEFSSSFVNDSVVDGGCPAGSSCVNIITTNPKLGILGDYGGLTQTIPLLPGSSAIDTGNDASCAATDQRGVSRPQGGHCDIGAYEYEQPLNNPPAITKITAPATPVQIGQSINATATFSDPDASDTHTVTWDWGDGVTTTTPAVVPSVAATHTYTSARVYTITATITDAAGVYDTETFQYVVSYDPDGGFVTGGGWITSPLGAYTPDPSLTGKATFGFVSKYQKGATFPTGNTQFQFHVAGMNFNSTSYDWLVIAGTKAQYKGTGMINGAGNFGFLLTAIDGLPDKFRIKIWDKTTGEVIYDNMPGASDDSNPSAVIEGGSIVVHKAK